MVRGGKVVKYENFVLNSERKANAVGKGMTRKILAFSKGTMLCELHFEKGAVGALHSHPHEQISYVVSGAFEFDINGVKKIVRAGDSLYKEPNVVHGAVCLEEGILLDFFSPMRVDFLPELED